MTLEERKYLEDILIAINDLEEILLDVKQLRDFINKKAFTSSAERKFEIMGVALQNLKRMGSTVELTHSKDIIGLRNRIAHAYDSVNYETLWSIFINHLPKLKSEVQDLINNS